MPETEARSISFREEREESEAVTCGTGGKANGANGAPPCGALSVGSPVGGVASGALLGQCRGWGSWRDPELENGLP